MSTNGQDGPTTICASHRTSNNALAVALGWSLESTHNGRTGLTGKTVIRGRVTDRYQWANRTVRRPGNRAVRRTYIGPSRRPGNFQEAGHE
jgi:hypothetical protein